jgi:hypothetical protein
MKKMSLALLALCLTLTSSTIVGINFCQSGSYWSTLVASCQTCGSVANSNGASIEQNRCGCSPNYVWNLSSQTCDSCTTNCPATYNEGHCAINSYFKITTYTCTACSNDPLSTSTSSN